MLEYLFREPNMITMHEARNRFVNDDEILISGAGYLPLENGDIWRRRRTRVIARRMHAWFFYYFLRPFNDKDDEIVAKKIIDLLTAWREIVELPPTRIPMAYHDEATAQRAISLSCFLQDYFDLISEDDKLIIRRILSESAALLSNNEFYSAGTNHGMYQDFALVVLSPHVSDGREYFELATRRLTEYFANAFTLEGIHKEQSPQYHFIVSNHLHNYARALAEHDSKTGNYLLEIFENTEKFSTLSITPLGKFPPVSDTSNELVSSLGYSRIYNSPEYQFAVTQGLAGTVPDYSQLITPTTGVAIYREDWHDPNSAYIYFHSAYNSDYHKHSDELSIYFVYKGLEILREAGPNGYEMRDPYTEYAYSSFGHNTLIVNGEGLPRTDSQSMGQVGLQSNASEEGADFSVCGWNYRFPGVKHERLVSFWSGHKDQQARRLQILDTVVAADPNYYQLLWQFGPEVRAQICGDNVIVFDRFDEKLLEIEIETEESVDLSIVEGQSSPDIQGWFFPKMGIKEPRQTLIISFSGDIELKLNVSLF